MSSVNKVILVGNVGKDPDVRVLASGESVVNLSLATSEQWTDKQSGDKKEAVEWHRVSLFGRTAEVVRDYVVKGAKLYIEGSLRTRKWTDKDGQDRYTTEVRGEVMKMLDKRPADGDERPRATGTERPRTTGDESKAYRAAKDGAPAPARPTSGFEDMDDDVPF